MFTRYNYHGTVNIRWPSWCIKSILLSDWKVARLENFIIVGIFIYFLIKIIMKGRKKDSVNPIGFLYTPDAGHLFLETSYKLNVGWE